MAVDAVTERMSEAERLLAEASTRVQSLSENAELASRSSAAIAEGSESLKVAAAQLAEAVATVKAATAATTEAMDAASAFLGATDLSSMWQRIQAVEEGIAALREDAAASAERDQEFRAALLAHLDRSRELEAERDALRARLQSVMNQIPQRVAKKIT